MNTCAVQGIFSKFEIIWLPNFGLLFSNRYMESSFGFYMNYVNKCNYNINKFPQKHYY